MNTKYLNLKTDDTLQVLTPLAILDWKYLSSMLMVTPDFIVSFQLKVISLVLFEKWYNPNCKSLKKVLEYVLL